MKRLTRSQVTKYVVIPVIVVAVAVLGYFTIKTTMRLDQLRKQAVLEATLGLALEKATRLDRILVDQDNTIMAIAEPEVFEHVGERWLPTARRETPTVRAVTLLDSSFQVLTWVSRAASNWEEEDAFRMLLLQRIRFDLELEKLGPDQLRHLHRSYGEQSYLISYWKRRWEGKEYLVVAWHDIGRVVRETFPVVYGEAQSAQRVNVVDEEGRNVFGPPLRTGEFTVGVRFPTTLYNWRVQVSPGSGEALAQGVKSRHRLELVLVALSFLAIVAGAIVVVVSLERERKLSLMRSEFVANVSHELKTPLALVRMFAEMLQSGRVHTEEKKQEYLGIIMQESERLTALIENVLDFAKLERGPARLELEDGDINTVVRAAVDALRFRTEQNAAELRLECSDAIGPLPLDERAVAMAITNLVDNAMKYGISEKERTIVVRTKTVRGGVQVDVEDRGGGVALADRARIFERFERGDPSARGQTRGSGIGLAIVKYVAESHRGKAWVETPEGDVGARFCMFFPQSSLRA
jgi:two-component system, OmpR family, phosphate regulon sensor histidine kinase PhoR